MKEEVTLRALRAEDAKQIHEAFLEQGWNKPAENYLAYFEAQKEGRIDFILAEWEGLFAGYLTIKWETIYPPFKQDGIPEVSDLNVLKKFHRKGIASKMMDEAERRVKLRSDSIGIGVGLTPDYGAAQVMYVKRGYIPDGRGVVQGIVPIRYGNIIKVGDGLILYLQKEL